jgi:hypothetical protein
MLVGTVSQSHVSLTHNQTRTEASQKPVPVRSGSLSAPHACGMSPEDPWSCPSEHSRLLTSFRLAIVAKEQYRRLARCRLSVSFRQACAGFQANLFLGGIYPDSLLFGGRFVLTALQGGQSSVDLIDRKSRRSTPTRICAHFPSTLSFL